GKRREGIGGAMPYIRQEQRDALLAGDRAQSPGELTYVLTVFMHDYVKRHGLRFETLNAVVGAVESAKREFQRMVVDPYEEGKRLANGSIGILRDTV
ncbi:MAG: hypothetical protein KGL39_60570, partial [Patescibacteria group bacterium]|nr:hypothetical protein [Patescibacteria group bacterium]